MYGYGYCAAKAVVKSKRSSVSRSEKRSKESKPQNQLSPVREGRRSKIKNGKQSKPSESQPQNAQNGTIPLQRHEIEKQYRLLVIEKERLERDLRDKDQQIAVLKEENYKVVVEKSSLSEELRSLRAEREETNKTIKWYESMEKELRNGLSELQRHKERIQKMEQEVSTLHQQPQVQTTSGISESVCTEPPKEMVTLREELEMAKSQIIDLKEQLQQRQGIETTFIEDEEFANGKVSKWEQQIWKNLHYVILDEVTQFYGDLEDDEDTDSNDDLWENGNGETECSNETPGAPNPIVHQWLTDIDNEGGTALISDMQHNIHHAFLAYGPGVTGILQESLSLLFQSQASMLIKCLNNGAKDILMDTLSLNRSRSQSNVIGAPHQPAFYLVLDEKQNKIVLSIRGSASIGDFITESLWDYTKWSDAGITGYVHEGWLGGAQYRHKSVTNTLINTRELMITGHSLGAGADGSLEMMYNDDSMIHGQDGQILTVCCFAAQCILSRAFTDQKLGNDYITSVVLDMDTASRISGIWNLRQKLISEYSTDKMEGVLQRDDKSDGDEGTKLLCVLKNVRSPNPEHELFPLVPHVALNEDIALRRKTMMNLSEDEDENKNDTDDGSEEAVCGIISSDEMSVDDMFVDCVSGSEGKEGAFQSEFESCIDTDDESLSEDGEEEEVSFHQNRRRNSLHRIRRRPMDQSSDEEEEEGDDDQNETLPQSPVPNAALQNNLFDQQFALVEELIEMMQDTETGAKCTVATKADENMNQIDTEETIASPGMSCTDGRRTERKDDQIGKKEVENKGMYRVRRRPLYQSSDEEEDDEEGANSECTPRKRFPVDKLPNLHRITSSIERLKSTYLQFSPHCM